MKKPLLSLVLTSLTLLLAGALQAQTQTTVTINCTGTTGSYKSGSVASTGANLNDGNMTVSNAAGTTPRGWAEFNLNSAGIPAGATIVSASYTFNKISVSGSGAPGPDVYLVDTNLSVPAAASLGSYIYTAIGAGTVVNSDNWAPGTLGTLNLDFNAAGISFLQNNLTDTISVGMRITTNSRVFTITGYGGTTTTQPQLTITYTSCPAGSTPFPQDFSNTIFPPCSYTTNGNAYLIRGNANGYAATGSGSIKFNFFSASVVGAFLDISTDPFTPVTSGTLSFDESYATYTTLEIDSLLIQTSTNGGLNYTTLIRYAGGQNGDLNTAGVVSSNFAPTLASQWTTKTVALPAGTNRIRFRGVSAYGNSLFLDNLMVTNGPPLTIKLSEITGTATGYSNIIAWTTKEEAATDVFVLQHSTDGKNFTDLANIHARGKASDYSYRHEKPATAANYYRIKLKDAAGNIAFSNTIVLKPAITPANTLSLSSFPNPVTDKILVSINGNTGNNARITLNNLNGQTLQSVAVTGNEQTINMNELPRGIYLLHYTDDANTIVQKITKL